MKNGRNTAGKFTAGNSGRPKGARNKKTLAIESLLQGQAEALGKSKQQVSEAVKRLIEIDLMYSWDGGRLFCTQPY